MKYFFQVFSKSVESLKAYKKIRIRKLKTEDRNENWLKSEYIGHIKIRNPPEIYLKIWNPSEKMTKIRGPKNL